LTQNWFFFLGASPQTSNWGGHSPSPDPTPSIFSIFIPHF